MHSHYLNVQTALLELTATHLFLFMFSFIFVELLPHLQRRGWSQPCALSPQHAPAVPWLRPLLLTPSEGGRWRRAPQWLEGDGTAPSLLRASSSTRPLPTSPREGTAAPARPGSTHRPSRRPGAAAAAAGRGALPLAANGAGAWGAGPLAPRRPPSWAAPAVTAGWQRKGGGGAAFAGGKGGPGGSSQRGKPF